MKRKGFTLIELLAVIVILAIIALIATPIVLDIIKDSKVSSKKRSQELYIESLNQEIARRQLSGKMLSDGVYSVGELEVPVKGDVPGYGYVYIKNGNIVNYYFSYKDGTINESSTGLELEKDVLNNTDPFSINAITLSFNNTIEFNFYVKKEEMDKYKDAYILVENDKKFINTFSLKEEIKNYIEKDGYYVFTYNYTSFQEFTNNQTITLVGTNSAGEKRTQIKYNVSDYIKNVTYNETTSEKSKKLLIALANAGGSAQTYFNYNATTTETNLGLVTNVLKEEDRNVNNILSSEGQSLLDNSDTLSDNNTDNPNIPFKINNNIWGIRENLYLAIRLKSNSTPTDEEKNNTGLLLFSKNSYDRMMKNGVDYNLMTIDSKYLLKDLNLKTQNERYSVISYGNYLQFTYFLNFNNPSEQIYYRPYYKTDDKYYYGDVGLISLMSITLSIDDSAKIKNTAINQINFISLLEK